MEQALPASCEADFSRIKVFSIQVPLLWKHRLKNVSFGLGPVINFNTYASIKNKYYDADGKRQNHTGNHTGTGTV